jgi:hypothetical protein
MISKKNTSNSHIPCETIVFFRGDPGVNVYLWFTCGKPMGFPEKNDQTIPCASLIRIPGERFGDILSLRSRSDTAISGVFQKWRYPKMDGLCKMENRIVTDDLGIPPFCWKPSYIHIYIFSGFLYIVCAMVKSSIGLSH